jgi:hypothetical protein
MAACILTIEDTDLENNADVTRFWSVKEGWWVNTREEATVFSSREEAEGTTTDVFGGAVVVEVK